MHHIKGITCDLIGTTLLSKFGGDKGDPVVKLYIIQLSQDVVSFDHIPGDRNQVGGTIYSIR